MQIGQIKTAAEFQRFMEEIWNMASEPTPDGGITIHQHPDYDQYHNAFRVVKLCGAKRTGTTRIAEPNDAGVWQFPDGTRVVVSHKGDAIKPPKHAVYSPRPH